MFDLLVRGGTVVTPAGSERRDIGISDGLFAEVGADLEGGAKETIDATGLHVFPGVVDAHVHCNDPGRADWEGLDHGTQALAAGGTTTFADMPLNASPPTLDGASFDLKLAVASRTAHVDFALWGGLVPGDVDRLDELADRGVIGFKAFMCPSGIDDFPAADDETLHAGMARAARLGLPVAVHAESAELTARLAAEAVAAREDLAARLPPFPAGRGRARGRRTARSRSPRRQPARFTSSTSRAAGRCGSSWRPAPAASTSRCETCPHYLALDEDDAVEVGMVAKCSPPHPAARGRRGPLAGPPRRGTSTWSGRTTHRALRS